MLNLSFLPGSNPLVALMRASAIFKEEKLKLLFGERLKGKDLSVDQNWKSTRQHCLLGSSYAKPISVKI